MGSGGATGANGTAGTGGGLIVLNITGTLTVNGTVTSDGTEQAFMVVVEQVAVSK